MTEEPDIPAVLRATEGMEELYRVGGYFYCDDCGCQFSSWPGDSTRLCGNCAATTHLPRCGHTMIVPTGLGSTQAYSCSRAQGHTGHHTYGRKRA